MQQSTVSVSATLRYPCRDRRTLHETRMKKLLIAILATVLVIVTTLAAILVLVQATTHVAAMANPMLRAAAVLAELLLGVVLLLGTLYLATHLAVRIYGPPRA